MIQEAINKILEVGGQVQQFEVLNRDFVALHGSYKEITPIRFDTIKVHTLQAIVDYFNEGSDVLVEDAIIHVLSPATVRVIDKQLCPTYGYRDVYVESSLNLGEFPFGRFLEQELMVINLLTMFKENPLRDEIIKAVSGLIVTGEVEVADDGVSQQVKTRTGVSRLESVEIKNPVKLKPIRTFSEVEQVEAPYVVRVQARDGAKPQIAIFEADGGAWENVAIARIVEWLGNKVPGVKILG
jgi:hypothetical protein